MNRKHRRAAERRGRGTGAGTVGARAPEIAPILAAAMRHHQAGQLLEAEHLYRQILAIDRNHVASLHHLGIIALQRGQPQAAVDAIGRAIAIDDGVPDSHYGVACAFQMLGRLHEAVVHYRHALRLEPRHAQAHNNLANTLADQGLVDEAVTHFQRAIDLDPKLVEAYVNLGSMLLAQGKLDAAAAQLERGLRLDPNVAEAHANLGDVFLAQGRLDDAVERYRRTLALKPDLAEAHNKLGVALAGLGQIEEARRRFQFALSCKPDFMDAYGNLARALLTIAQAESALTVLKRALAIAETPEIKSLFVQCARCLPVVPNDDDFRALVVRALSEPWGRANDLAPLAASIVKQDRAIKTYIDGTKDTRMLPPTVHGLLGADGVAAISSNRVLRCLLEAGPICDGELERFLTHLRSAMLQTTAATDPHQLVDLGVLNLCCALARQCFLNEYVFASSDEEVGAARRLRDSLIAVLASGSAIPEFNVAVVAAYFPLHSLSGAELLLNREWSEPLTAVLVQQVREPAQEHQLRGSIPVLTAIDHDVSRRVRQQYEENPYPRWSQADPPKRPLLVDQYLRSKFPASVFSNLGKTEIDLLIAGCGTGRHAIETAQRFAGARVLAVDLSGTSLAYAARKTRALGRHNIEYGQADILALASLGRTFDVIESSGVLHHLADPFVGWRVLLSLLRPGGFMAIGLYSEIARANIVGARAFIAERGYGATAEEIRRCRQDIVALDTTREFRNVSEIGDFFSTSGCRDLLFHVQEHRLTLPQIAQFLAENDLRFVGFELEPFVSRHYLTRFPDDKAMIDLACWDVFEREHPDTFSAMYQFWVQTKR